MLLVGNDAWDLLALNRSGKAYPQRELFIGAKVTV
jgi:hypothetical protein